MKNIYQFLKNIKLKRILTVFLASSLLVISTACSNGANSDVARSKSESIAASSDTYDKYDRNESYKGGMNSYSDDRRYDSDAAAKAQTLVDTAKRRKADSLGEYTDNVIERSVVNEDVNERATKAFSNKLERNKDKAAEYIDNKSDKLGRNIQKLPGQTKNVVEGAADTAQDAAQDAAKATKKTSRNIKNNFKELGDDIN